MVSQEPISEFLRKDGAKYSAQQIAEAIGLSKKEVEDGLLRLGRTVKREICPVGDCTVPVWQYVSTGL